MFQSVSLLSQAPLARGSRALPSDLFYTYWGVGVLCLKNNKVANITFRKKMNFYYNLIVAIFFTITCMSTHALQERATTL